MEGVDEKRFWKNHGFHISFLVGGVTFLMTYFMQSFVQVDAIPSHVASLWFCVLAMVQMVIIISGLVLFEGRSTSQGFIHQAKEALIAMFSKNVVHTIVVILQAAGALAALALQEPSGCNTLLAVTVIFQASYRLVMALDCDMDVTLPTSRMLHTVLTFNQLSFWYVHLMAQDNLHIVDVGNFGEISLPLMVLFNANSCVEMAWLASGKSLASNCAANKPLGIWFSIFLAVVSYYTLPVLSLLSDYPYETGFNTAVVSSGLAILLIGIMIGMKWSEMEHQYVVSVWAILAFSSWGLVTMALAGFAVTKGHSILEGNFAIKMAEHALLVMVGYMLHYFRSRQETPKNRKVATHPYEAIVEIN